MTLDTFTESVQHEIKDDKLPIIMINGKKKFRAFTATHEQDR